MFGDDGAGQVGIEEFANHVEALASGHFGYVLGRLDTDVANAFGGKVLQHDAIVATDFGHQGVGVRKIAFLYPISKGSEVLGHAAGSGGEEGVFPME